VGETTLIHLSRLVVLRRQLDVAANNIANVENTGFRAQHLSFQEYLKPESNQVVGIKPERPLSLVDAAFGFTADSPGGLQITTNPLDLAINGNAYFVVQTPQGERYTRDGSFSLDKSGRLVTMEGHTVQAGNGAVTVPTQADSISIDASGRISTKLGELGRLRLVQFPERGNLHAVGGNLFRSDSAPAAISDGSAKVLQGMVEKSNVQPTVEISRLAEINKAYEMVSKLLKSSQDVTELNRLADVPD
jgi:flagellar basal-body rod protein FlgF